VQNGTNVVVPRPRCRLKCGVVGNMVLRKGTKSSDVAEWTLSKKICTGCVCWLVPRTKSDVKSVGRDLNDGNT